MIKKLSAFLVLIAGLSFGQAEASASPYPKVPASHASLARALDRVGVSLGVGNFKACGGNDGAYFPQKRSLIICKNANGAWTPDDLDTLRHEAHHVVQDCAAGDGLGNNLALFFNNTRDLDQFARKALPLSKLNWIVDSYRDRGHNDNVISLEIEAFAVAESVSPDAIATVLLQMCPAR